MHLGKNITFYRKKLDISSRKLALLVGISPGYLADIERGDKTPSIDMLENICSYLNIPLKEIFSDEATLEPLTPELLDLINIAKKIPPTKLNVLTKFINEFYDS